jgi:hypothetical protein
VTRADEARLLYTLLASAAEEERLAEPRIAERWRELKQRCENSHSEREHAALSALLDDLDREGILVGTWIQSRWLAAKARSAVQPPSAKKRSR